VTENFTPHTPHPDVDEVADFDAWRSEQRARRGGGKRVRVFGRVVEMPTSIPLGLTIDMDRLAGSDDLRDIQRVVGQVYGAQALDHWIEHGVELEDFQVLMAYGVATAGGQDITFDRAAELVAELRAKDAARQQARAEGKDRKKKRKKRGPGGGSPAAGH
jgi:hypothetical protein